jgi:hypothetical protein
MSFLMERNWRAQHPLPKGLETLEVSMKLVKSLLLGSAAGFVAVAGAQAADLPMRKAAPVEYVRVCSVHGVGFFYIPGTDTCLRVGGRVRAEYRYNTPQSRVNDAVGYRVRARLNIDSRTSTDWGTLRAFFRYELTVNNGAYNTRNTADYNAAGVLGGGSTATSTSLIDKAFIQFAGITAGRLNSFFDFYSNDINYANIIGSDNSQQDLLAYTATFGGGFSATLSIEDRADRQIVANIPVSGFTALNAGGSVATFGFPATVINGVAFAPGTYLPGGERMPDVVGNLRVDQPWGSAQLSGAVHQLYSVNRDALGGFTDTEYGYAVQGGVKVNLPNFAAGDVLWLQAAYASGAMSYIGFQNVGRLNTVGGISTAINDAYVDPLGNTKLTRAFGVTAAFTHYFWPTVRASIYGGYAKIDSPTSATAFNLVSGARLGAFDANIWQIGGQAVWSPVRNLDIGLEVLYTRTDPSGRVIDTNRNFVAAAGPGGFPAGTIPGLFTKGADDNIETRLRFQRDF